MAAKDSKAKIVDAPQRRSKKATILLVLISLVMVVVFRLGFIFILLAMLPSVVAFYIDISKGRYTFHTVLACNLSGVLPFVPEIISATSSGGSVSQMMSNTVNWLIVYASAGVGWILIYVVPMAAQAFIHTMHDRQISRLQRMQNRILEEWGNEVEETNNPKPPTTNS
jgi:hypothetical protein